MLQNYSAEIEKLISETKYYGHGYWKFGDFMNWADKSIEELKSNNYKIFEKYYCEVVKLSTCSRKFNVEISKCLSILKRIKKRSMKQLAS